MSLKYAGNRPRAQSKTVSPVLNVMRCGDKSMCRPGLEVSVGSPLPAGRLWAGMVCSCAQSSARAVRSPSQSVAGIQSRLHCVV